MNILTQRHMGIPAVWHRTSSQPGPHVCVGMATHGNETEGLAVLEEPVALLKGSLTLILCNPEAVAAGQRYLDSDMNRLPEGLNGSGREVARAQELLPLLQAADVFVDLHSTPGPTEPMLIPVEGAPPLAQALDIPLVIEGITELQTGTPLAALATGTRFGVEVGQQGTEEGRKTARRIFRALLQHHGLIEGTPEPGPAPVTYRVTGSIHFEDPTCKFLPRLLAGSLAGLRKGTAPWVEKGEVVAYGDLGALVAPETGYLLFPRREPSNLKTEAAFFASREA